MLKDGFHTRLEQIQGERHRNPRGRLVLDAGEALSIKAV